MLLLLRSSCAVLAASVAVLTALVSGCSTNATVRSIDHSPIASSLAVAAAAFDAGQIEPAERIYSALASAEVPSGWAWLGLGRIALSTGDYPLAARRFDEALVLSGAIAPVEQRDSVLPNRLDPRDPALAGQAYLGLARVALSRSRTSVALRETDEGLRHTPADPWLLNARAVALVRSGRAAEAAALYRESRVRGLPGAVEATRLRVLLATGAFDEVSDRLLDLPPSALPVGAHTDLAERLDAARAGPVAAQLRLSVDLSGRLCLDHPMLSEPCGLSSPPSSRASRPFPTRGLPIRIAVGDAAIFTTPFALDEASVAVGTGSSASPILEVHPMTVHELRVIAHRPGRAVLHVLSRDGERFMRTVEAVPDLSPVLRAFTADPTLSSVRVDPLLHGAILSGTAASIEAASRAERIVRAVLGLDVPVENTVRLAAGQQVRLEVQIAEVSRSVTERLGVSWELFFGENAGRFGMRYGVLPALEAVTGSAVESLIDSPSAFVPYNLAPGLGLFGGARGADGRFRVLLDALAHAGLANVLARPVLVAASGEPASFFSGSDHPYAAGREDDGDLIIDYRSVGVLLDFIPTVLSGGRISLTVAPEVSEIDLAAGVRVGTDIAPSFPTRRAHTVVEVGDGQSLVIAGLYRQHSLSNEVGIPGLKDVPALGRLFSSTSTVSSEVELLVIVTAHLVEARDEGLGVSPSSARVPHDGYYY